MMKHEYEEAPGDQARKDDERDLLRLRRMSIRELRAEFERTNDAFIGAALAWENGPYDYIDLRLMAPF
jgi:hypothetical protein